MVFQVQVWYEDKCISLVRVLILHFFLYSYTCMYYHSSFYFYFSEIHVSFIFLVVYSDHSCPSLSLSTAIFILSLLSFIMVMGGGFTSSPPTPTYLWPRPLKIISLLFLLINNRKRQTTLKLPAPPLLPPLPQPLTTPQQLPLPLPPLHLLPPH